MQIFCKNMFHKKSFLRRRSSKKKIQTIFALGRVLRKKFTNCQRDLFFQINLLKDNIQQIQKKNLYAFYEFFCFEMMALKNPPNFKRFLPSFPIAQFTFGLAGSCLHFSHFQPQSHSCSVLKQNINQLFNKENGLLHF